MTRDDVVRMAHECDIHVSEGTTFADDCYISVLYRFANKAIEHFLATTGQYVTNDASREAAIQAAVEAEREACATICDELESYWAAEKDIALLNGDVDLSNASSGEPRAARAIATAIRARGEK